MSTETVGLGEQPWKVSMSVNHLILQAISRQDQAVGITSRSVSLLRCLTSIGCKKKKKNPNISEIEQIHYRVPVLLV